MGRPSKKNGAKRHRPADEAEVDRLDAEATYVCDSCGEEIVVPVDVTGGGHQEYVEDCPVCCHPMRWRVDIDEHGQARIEGEHE